MFRIHRRETAMNIAWVIQHNDLSSRMGANRLDQLGPSSQRVIGQRTSRTNRERIEMTHFARNLVAHYRSEMLINSHLLRWRRIVSMVIMIRRHGELDAFPGNRDHAFINGRIAMAAVSQRVNMAIGGHPALSGYGSLNLQRKELRSRFVDDHSLRTDAILEPAAGVDRINPR